jgi:hypothetical protein
MLSSCSGFRSQCPKRSSLSTGAHAEATFIGHHGQRYPAVHRQVIPAVMVPVQAVKIGHLYLILSVLITKFRFQHLMLILVTAPHRQRGWPSLTGEIERDGDFRGWHFSDMVRWLL